MYAKRATLSGVEAVAYPKPKLIYTSKSPSPIASRIFVFQVRSSASESKLALHSNTPAKG